MSVSIILAKSKNNVIGKNNDLPWRLPTDLKRFKEITLNSTVIMGRKCYESIPEKFRPLPNRVNVVLTRDTNYKADGCEVRHNLEDAIKEFNIDDKEIFIIGGADIYKESFIFADKLYITQIITDVEGDVYLEGLDASKWGLTKFEGPYREDNLDYRFEEYVSLDKMKDYGEKADN